MKGNPTDALPFLFTDWDKNENNFIFHFEINKIGVIIILHYETQRQK